MLLPHLLQGEHTCDIVSQYLSSPPRHNPVRQHYHSLTLVPPCSPQQPVQHIPHVRTNRRMPLPRQQMGPDLILRQMRRQPLAMRKGGHRVRVALPQADWDFNLAQLKAPRLHKRQVVVDPAVGAHLERRLEGRDHFVRSARVPLSTPSCRPPGARL